MRLFSIQKGEKTTTLLLKRDSKVTGYVFAQTEKGVELLEYLSTPKVETTTKWDKADYNLLKPYLVCILKTALEAWS